ncbi:hypothetical protein EK599_03520 [Vibrio sp. T187]|uniref:hypothetical protein n=1 Tax=Vibrio TaxID=662 RepID=UPI0010CA0381|nr:MULTISPECIES: hypothetical protein [Vibrio]MBW3694748.1 hypothetical protein [Vibrio sp. T187]
MIESLLMLFAPMLLGALSILTLILVKGDICPGQRGRIHKLLPAIGVLWIAIASVRIEAFMIVFAVFYFFSQVQTKKTRDQGPIWLLHLANGLALAYVAIQAFEQPTLAATIATFISIALLGASFAHILLTIARTRLQAFHRILPVVGVISGMCMVLATLLNAYSMSEAELELVTKNLLFGFALLISSIIVWCWHLFFVKAPEKIQLGLASVMLVVALLGLSQLWAL